MSDYPTPYIITGKLCSLATWYGSCDKFHLPRAIIFGKEIVLSLKYLILILACGSESTLSLSSVGTSSDHEEEDSHRRLLTTHFCIEETAWEEEDEAVIIWEEEEGDPADIQQLDRTQAERWVIPSRRNTEVPINFIIFILLLSNVFWQKPRSMTKYLIQIIACRSESTLSISTSIPRQTMRRKIAPDVLWTVQHYEL